MLDFCFHLSYSFLQSCACSGTWKKSSNLTTNCGPNTNLDSEENVKLWTCLVTPGRASTSTTLSDSLRSVSSVSETVPPGCRQEDGFLENGRLLLRELREWRVRAPILPSASSSIPPAPHSTITITSLSPHRPRLTAPSPALCVNTLRWPGRSGRPPASVSRPPHLQARTGTPRAPGESHTASLAASTPKFHPFLPRHFCLH